MQYKRRKGSDTMLDLSVYKKKISEKSESTIEYLIEDILEGRISLPEFQRDYVWNMEQVKNLLISIISGKIVGGILIWETDLDIKAKMIIPAKERQRQQGKYHYLLDGQQRITSLFYAIKGGKFGRNDFSKLYIDLKAERIEDFIVVKGKKDVFEETIPFVDIFKDSFQDDYQDDLTSRELTSLLMLSQKIVDYSISIFKLKTNKIEEAVSQFNSLNSGGKNMTVADIVLSKIYSNDFKLKEELQQLTTEMSVFGLSEKICLDVLMFGLKGEYSSNALISLTHDEVKSQWKRISQSIRAGVDYSHQLGFHHMDMYPYKHHFVGLTKILFDKQIVQLNAIQQQNFLRLVLSSGITKNYLHSSSNRFKHDMTDLLLHLDNPAYVPLVSKKIDFDYLFANGNNFSGKLDSFSKSILWMLMEKKPLSFKNNNVIQFTKKSNSKKYDNNLHHIFPRGEFKNYGFKYPIDHLVNICLIESGINQVEISAKKPSVYFEEFRLQNPLVQKACDTHFIPYDTIKSDDYEKFFEARSSSIISMIHEHLPDTK